MAGEGSPVQGQEPPQQGRSQQGFDPTQNVLNLATSIEKMVAAAMQRQDDLRERDALHAREMRETARMYEARIDRKEEQIRGAETARIDAIRTVDVQAGQRREEVQAAQAQALAAQLAATAEASRAQVAAAAAAAVTSLAAALEPIQKDIRDLRDAQSQARGGKEQTVESRDVGADTRSAEQVRAAEAQARSARMYGGIAAAIAAITLLLYIYTLARQSTGK